MAGKDKINSRLRWRKILMCRVNYLYDVTKDGNDCSIYSVDDVKSGAAAYDFLLNISKRRVITPELFIAVRIEGHEAEYLYTSDKESYVYPKNDPNTAYRTFTLCGKYDKKPVCLSFHMYNDIGDAPFNVLAILSAPHTGAMKARLAERLAGVS